MKKNFAVRKASTIIKNGKLLEGMYSACGFSDKIALSVCAFVCPVLSEQ